MERSAMGIEQVIEDWDSVKKRFEAWWQFEIYDRPLLSVTAPRRGIPPTGDTILTEQEIVAQWTDVDFMIRRGS